MTARPRPKARLVLDVDNPYARLGVSPLVGIDEIKRVASDRRGQWMAKRRREGQIGTSDTEAKIIEIQDIEKQIGTAEVRAAYDREHPQNVLLTVQPGPRDRGLGPAGASTLVTEWLAEELGPDALLIHPDALWLWLPAIVDPVLMRVLERFGARTETSQQTENSWRSTTRS
jgi:hypothetical protein